MRPRLRQLRHRLTALVPPFVLLSLGLYAVWPWLRLPGGAPPPRTLIVYGFSITGPAMNDGIFPAFQAHWLAQTGERVEFVGSFAGSGTITNQIIMGVPADLALLALELDAQRLVDAGILPGSTWRDLPHDGVLNRSPFVIAVRPGNPLGIGDFADLARPGVGVVHPDPLTSGAANWSILAEYGAAGRRQPAVPGAGRAQLAGIWGNVVAQAASARAARTQFDNGFGDALITYEQDLWADSHAGTWAGTIVYPPSTILSEHTLVVLDRNIAPDERDLVDAFVAFLWSDAAQRRFADYGFRSVDPALNADRFPPIADPFTVADLGGWSVAHPQIIEAIWKDQVLPELNR